MEQGFPGAHVTNVAGTTTTVEPRFRYDPSYVRTLPGQLKIVQMVGHHIKIKLTKNLNAFTIWKLYFCFQILNLLGCIFITSSQYSYHGRAGYFNTIAMGGFWFTGILLVMYLFHIIEKFHGIPWLKIVSYNFVLVVENKKKSSIHTCNIFFVFLGVYILYHLDRILLDCISSGGWFYAKLHGLRNCLCKYDFLYYEKFQFFFFFI